MTPEEKAVIDTSIAYLKNSDARPAWRDAVEKLLRHAPEPFSLAGEPGASTFPCWECLTDPTEDPRSWCDCRSEDFGKSDPNHPCLLRAHTPDRCLNRPDVEVIKRDDLTGHIDEEYCTCPKCHPEWHKDDAGPIWVQATLLYCLAGDRIRIGTDETDVLRSSSGAWHANVVSSVMPSGKTWDKVTPWEHVELRLDLSANPGFREYPPNTPCEILCTPERRAVLLLMTAFPGTKEIVS